MLPNPPVVDAKAFFASPQPEDTRFCRGCARFLPVEAFRLRSATSPYRQSRCRPCLAKYMRSYRSARRDDRLARFTARIRRESSAAALAGALAAMNTAMGGPVGLAVGMKRLFDSSVPGSRRSADVLLAILRLLELVPAPEARRTSLSDAELEAEVWENVVALVRQNPQLAITAAAELGWQVAPPAPSVG